MILWGKKEEAMFNMLYFLLGILPPDQRVLLNKFIEERRDEK